MRALPLPALPLLLLPLLGILVPAAHATPTEPCIGHEAAGHVCVTSDAGCLRVDYEPPFEDFAALAQHCESATLTPGGGEARCSHLKAGTYAKPETREIDGTLCATTSRNANGAGCLALSYDGNLARIPPRPVCVLP